MTWFKTDDRLTFHRKTVQAGNAAIGAWVRIGAWCAGYETDGVIPAQVAATIASREELAALVGAGFLTTRPDGSYEMHDFLKYNPSRADLEAQRAAYADRQKRYRETRESRVVSRVTERVTPGRDGTGDIQTAEAETELTDNDNGTAGREALTADEQTRVRKLVKHKRRTALPEDWSPPTDEHAHSWHHEARRQGLTASEVERAAHEFKLHHAARGELRADWTASWRLWLSRVRAYGQRTVTRESRVYGRDMGRPVPSEGYDWDAHERLEREDRRKRKALEAAADERKATLELNAKKDVALAQLVRIGGSK